MGNHPPCQWSVQVGVALLVIKEFMMGGVLAYPVRGNGLEAAPERVDHIIGDLSARGLDKARIVTKSDQEPAIKEVQDEFSKRRREMSTVPGTTEENSRVGDSSSNGRVERCIQEIGGLTRTLKIAPEVRLGVPMPLDHPLVHWLTKHAADFLNKCQVRDAGNTHFEMVKGRACIEPICSGVRRARLLPAAQDEAGD